MTDSGRSLLLGLIGAGIQRSRSPGLHQAEADRQGLRCLYQLIDLAALGLRVEDLPALLDAAQRMGFRGLNITYPCKQAVISLLDELSDDARRIGAVNTVVFDGKRRIGHNTDAWGFAEGLRRAQPGGGLEANLGPVLQLGAGGAGSATASALLALGVSHLWLYDADAGRAAGLAAKMNAAFGGARAAATDDPLLAASQARGLVNATPIGMASHPGMAIPPEALRPDLWVAEIVYFPLETELLRRARALGCVAIDGGGMAVFQAARAFQLFTGREPDAGAMMQDFRRDGAGEEVGACVAR